MIWLIWALKIGPFKAFQQSKIVNDNIISWFKCPEVVFCKNIFLAKRDYSIRDFWKYFFWLEGVTQFVISENIIFWLEGVAQFVIRVCMDIVNYFWHSTRHGYVCGHNKLFLARRDYSIRHRCNYGHNKLFLVLDTSRLSSQGYKKILG